MIFVVARMLSTLTCLRLTDHKNLIKPRSWLYLETVLGRFRHA